MARLLPLADPDRFSRPAPQPSPQLGERIAATIGGERRAAAQATAAAALRPSASAARWWRPRRRCWRSSILPGGGGGNPEQHVEFASLPAGVKIDATLEPHAYGTEIHMYVNGSPLRHPLPGLPARRRTGPRVPAGTFRYRWGDDSEAVLSSALDLSRTRAIGVRAGNRTFVAPVDVTGATADDNRTRRTRRDQDHLRIRAAGSSPRRWRSPAAAAAATAAPAPAPAAPTAAAAKNSAALDLRGSAVQRSAVAAVSVGSAANVGPVLVDSKGLTLYDFHKDQGQRIDLLRRLRQRLAAAHQRRRSRSR